VDGAVWYGIADVREIGDRSHHLIDSVEEDTNIPSCRVDGSEHLTSFG